jgi:hypothetical protein
VVTDTSSALADDLRTHLAGLLGTDPAAWPAGRATYDLRRLRLHGLITRITLAFVRACDGPVAEWACLWERARVAGRRRP